LELFLKAPILNEMKARRLQFGYLKSISSLDEKTFPMLIRSVSMKELSIIFPNLIIGLILFLKQEIIYATIPFMLALFVLFYNEKSVPFYYQFLALVTDFLTMRQKGKKPNVTKPIKINEKSVPFYYQFLALVTDFLTMRQKGKKPNVTKPIKINRDYFKKYKRELELLELSTATLALTVMLYIIQFQLELYTKKINVGMLIGLSAVAGLILAFVIIKLIGLVSKR
jgi:hypothetical protein